MEAYADIINRKPEKKHGHRYCHSCEEWVRVRDIVVDNFCSFPIKSCPKCEDEFTN